MLSSRRILGLTPSDLLSITIEEKILVIVQLRMKRIMISLCYVLNFIK